MTKRGQSASLQIAGNTLIVVNAALAHPDQPPGKGYWQR
jgi:hypothetical protein